MCEEISYDEIYMPGELDADADTARTQNSRSAEDNNATSPEPSEGKPTASHPPNEIVENVMRHVESELSKDREKKASTAAASESSENEKARKSRSSPKRRRRKSGRGSPTYSDSASSRSSRSRSRSRSRRSPRKSRRKHRRTSPKKRARSSSSSSRGTYEGFEFFLPEDECPYACKQCHRGFYTIKELAEHEIRAHDMKIPCAHCDKNAISVTKLAAHMLFRHAALDVLCHYCDQKFGGPADKLDKSTWDDFRGHVYKV